MEPSTNQTSLAVPIAIIVGFTLIAVAIFFTNHNKTTPAPQLSQDDQAAKQDDSIIKPVGEDDYILGNPNAPIVLVEYSDYDCPFCKQFHATMHQIMDEYGITGKVAWVYRQLPLPQLHPNSPKISKAALCVGDIGGNKAFWEFSDLIFDARDINELTNVTKLPEYAEKAGVSKTDYIACMEDDAMEKVVTDSIADAINQGADGTPYNLILVGNQSAVLNGAQSYDTIKSIIKNLIDQLEGTFPETAATTTTNEITPITITQ